MFNIKRKAGPTALLAVGGLWASVTACSSQADDGAVQAASGSEAAAIEITDPDGKVWVATRNIEAFDDSPIKPPEGGGTVDRADSSYTVQELAARLRPVMEFAGMEYQLSDADALKFARAIHETIQNDEADGETLIDESMSVDGDAAPDLDSGLEGRDVFGTDNRERVSDPSSNKPWHWIASQGTSNCTAFKMIDNYTAVSAAHCHHTGSSWRTRQTLQFGASSSDGSAYAPLDAQCYSRTVPDCWDGSDRSCDYAVIRLRGGGPWCNYDDYNVGKFGYQGTGSCVNDINGSLAGYPGKNDDPPPGSWTAPEMFWHQNSTGRTECFGINPNKIWYENDSSGGQSGSPYWTYSDGTRYVRGIHFGAKDNKNGARRITSGLIDWLESNSGY